MLLGIRKLTTDWQVGDGREEALRDILVFNERVLPQDRAITRTWDLCLSLCNFAPTNGGFPNTYEQRSARSRSSPT